MGAYGWVRVAAWTGGSIATRYGRAFDPLGGVPHIIVSILACLMSVFDDPDEVSDLAIALLCLWGLHSVVLLLGILERACRRQLRWRQGVAWVVAMYFAFIACAISL